jgi:hypothetical protein
VTERLGKAVKTRKTYLISGVNPDTGYLAYNPTIVGMERAILERLIYIHEDGVWRIPPVPRTGLFEERMSCFTQKLDGFAVRRHPLEHKDFALCYHGPRRARYLKAAENLRDKSVCKKDAELKYFLKLETYDFIRKFFPSPRGINPRTDEYLCSLGAYLHPVEKEIYKNIGNVFGYPVVMKGFNQQDRGRLLERYWKEIDDCVAIPIDASRFEQSVGVDALKWEHSRYRKYYKGDKLLAKLLKWQLYNKGRARASDGHLSFEVDGRRMSGDKNTALGNCLISSGLGHSFMHSLGLRVTQYRFFCDGDDAVLFISKRHLKKVSDALPGWFREMGFRMKVEKTAYSLEEVDFCQSRPVWTPEGYLMVREPRRALSKDAVSKKPLDSLKTYQRWIASVGTGGVSMCGGIPVCQAFYECLRRNAHGAKPLHNDSSLSDFFQYKVHGMARKLSTIHPRTRASFSIAFGLSPDSQIAIEEQYDQTELQFGMTIDVLSPSAGW